jgi:hypothetical protein
MAAGTNPALAARLFTGCGLMARRHLHPARPPAAVAAPPLARHPVAAATIYSRAAAKRRLRRRWERPMMPAS